MATTTYEPLGTYTVSGSSTNSITFNSITGYTDLYIVGQYGIITSADKYLRVTFNGDSTASNYSMTNMRGNDPTPSSNRYSGAGGIYDVTAMGTSKSSLLSMARINIMNYSNSTTYKTFMSRVDNDYDGVMGTLASVSLWQNTAPITSVTITTNDGTNFYSGSKFDIYGIANAVIEAPKATGGTITYDNTYFYHTFGASGTFTPQQSLTCDFLVIAGGGGAGSYNGGGGTGGGGAGGLRSSVVATGGGGTLESPLSLSATAYTVTVGAGGPGASGYNVGTQGGTSSISTITTVGGGRSTADQDGGLGGSGGGGYGYPGTYVGGAGTANQGYAGGNGTTDGATWTTAGGGGGAGAVGGNGNTTKAGDGGAGVSIPVIANTTGTGVATYYAGGGGGAGSGGKLGAAGGLGGGGTGGNSGSGGTNGVANTGSGGGGNGGAGTSGNGGSGVVIIRYLKA